MGTDNNYCVSGGFCEVKECASVNINFEDVSYIINGREKKKILKSLSGKFYSGELNAILGASGSGKTALLNILSGYISQGVTGSIQFNGSPRSLEKFRTLSTYIMQEDLLQPLLSLEELMMVTAKLKLGDHTDLQQKQAIVTEIIQLLHLESCLHTRTENLSGGERKRLSIALEMINNPPVIFLDEPTSGLDTVAVEQCMKVLKNLTKQGRTIVCTIHQPSTTMFHCFNQLYFLQNGMCIYNGSSSNVVPFMSSVGFECPVTYCPSDYLIETAQIEEFEQLFAASIENGKINKRNESYRNSARRTFNICEGEPTTNQKLESSSNPKTSFCTQFWIIFSRMILQTKRNQIAIYIQLFCHLAMGLLFGRLFYQIGNNGAFAVSNYKLVTCVMIFFVYTYLFSTVLLFPSEVQLLKREFRNGWYDLKPYFLALTLRNLPLMIIFGTVFVLIVYIMTDQPLEILRLTKFTTVCILTATTTEALGLLLASIFSVTNGSVLASVSFSPLFILSVYGMGYGSAIPFVFKILMYLSYLRYVLVALYRSILDDRGPFDCPDDELCYYRDAKHVARDMGFEGDSFALHVFGVIIWFIIFRITAFLLLKMRLTSEMHRMLKYQAAKVFGTK